MRACVSVDPALVDVAHDAMYPFQKARKEREGEPVNPFMIRSLAVQRLAIERMAATAAYDDPQLLRCSKLV